MQCVILTGALETRLWPVREKMIRPAFPLGNLPFVHYQLSWLAAQGITEVVYSFSGLDKRIISYVGAGALWGLRVVASDEAVLLDDWLFVLSGPSFLPVDFRHMSEVFLHQERPALMAVSCNRGLYPGDVRYAAGVVQLYQKARKGEVLPVGMEHGNCGLSILSGTVVADSRSEELSALYHRLSIEGRLAGMEVSQRFYELGSPEGSGGRGGLEAGGHNGVTSARNRLAHPEHDT